MNYKVLLIEDDEQIREIIEDSFTAKSNGSITLQSSSDGTTGLELATSTPFDLILLDILLPGIDGFSIIRSIRKTNDVPVIFLTARAREEDVLYGYELGCDDYVTKPFSTAALYAKSMALINRDKKTIISQTLSCGKIRVNKRSLLVTVNGEEVILPPIEFSILVYLIENKGWVVERGTLLSKVWGPEYFGGTRVVDNHIKKLRHLLKDGGSQIKTVISKGYKITD